MAKVGMYKTDGKLVAAGVQENVREKVEDLLMEKYGFYPSLQEDTEDGEFRVYLHTDSYEDLSDKQLEVLDKAGITDDPERATVAICKVLGVRFEILG